MDSQSERGSAVIVALGFMVLVFVIGAGVQGLVVGQLRGSGSLRERTAADHLAQGGLARALGWFQSVDYQLPQSSQLQGAVPVTLVNGGGAVVLPTNHPDGYIDASGKARSDVVKSFNSYLTAQENDVGRYNVTASLIASQPETWEVLVAAEVGTTARNARALLVRKQESLFGDALFGRSSVTLSENAYTDGYDASSGAYGGSNILATGHVGSNGPISLSGNAVVEGDARPGPGESVTFADSARVRGSTAPAGSAKTLPVPTIPGDAVDLGAISLRGNRALRLSSGSYLLSSLSITGNGQLTADNSNGAVTLYVTGTIAIRGNGIRNLSGMPGLLAIVQVGGANVTVGGGAALYGTIYAPDSSLTINGAGHRYGSFIGNVVSLSGTGGVHYDQALRAATASAGPLRVMVEWIGGS
jgi:hypothetical protein